MHPQTRRHLVNNERLRSSAIREFALHGLTGAKVSNIVANANLTQPSFYRLWASKEAAYQEIIEQTVRTWHTAAALVFESKVAWTPENLLEQLEASTFKLFRALTFDLDLTALVIRHQSNDGEDRKIYLSIYEQGFRDLQKNGVIQESFSPEVLGQAYFALTERFFYARLFTGKASPRETAHEVTLLMIRLLTDSPQSNAASS
ncbi:TetR/AcrR family transcriptional regulator [Deinococcus irradiatisoli]|uniref:TetR/AcrR family transcriptional regulator n=1 Tax=Deinococcus irradiatisoli TaxID=2202254 RepID=UPI0015E841D9|nr:TetR/AcrR family transcriptional regulator [Deinococcus irradiatisoli]